MNARRKALLVGDPPEEHRQLGPLRFRQGGAEGVLVLAGYAVDLLLSSGEKIVAVTRHPATAAMPEGVHVIGADPSHLQILEPKLGGIKAILLSPRALGDATAGTATTELLALAAKQGTPQVVVLSAATVEYGGGYRWRRRWRVLPDDVAPASRNATAFPTERDGTILALKRVIEKKPALHEGKAGRS